MLSGIKRKMLSQALNWIFRISPSQQARLTQPAAKSIPRISPEQQMQDNSKYDEGA